MPIVERSFLADQRTVREMKIGGIDVVLTRQLARREKRKHRYETYVKLQKETSAEAGTSAEAKDPETSIASNDTDPEISQDSDIEVQTNAGLCGKKRTFQMRLDLPTVARECDRHGVSDRSAASLVSAVLQDVGIINEHDNSMVIDRSKIRRARKRVRKALQHDLPASVSALYFDGRKDRTRIQVKKGKKYYAKTIVEEHVTLVYEPNSVYLGHITPSSGASKSIENDIITFLRNKNINTDELHAIGCDGTNVNTGAVGGVIRLLELTLRRPLQWLICLLNANELPLRHLMQKLDGGTQGPNVFSGFIGKALQTCEQLPVVQYSTIMFENCPTVDGADLSTDQQYMYDMCIAVSSGQCSPDLALQKPGPIVHSRWLTMANRVLRLYVATNNPSDNLQTLVLYVMKVYAPIWFHVKTKPLCSDGARHLWRLIKYTRYLSPELREIVDPVIQRNGFFGHSENILLAMITDSRKHIRELAHRRIIAARMEHSSSALVRQFRVPVLNFGAEDYVDLVAWQDIDRHAPPVMDGFSDQQIRGFVANSDDVVTLEHFPCHTQAVERHVKLVTESSAAVCGQQQRDGFIRSRIESRRVMKTFNTKSQYRFGSV